MATKRKFNFGKIDEALTSEGKQNSVPETVKDSVNISDETEKMLQEDSSNESGKAVVTEQIDKIGRTNDYKKAFNFKLIPRKKLVFHEENDFPMQEIEELAKSILEFGLIHNLEAAYDENMDIYIIESGERRTRAIDMLIESFGTYQGNPDDDDYKNYLKNVKQFEIEGYPVNVKIFDPEEYTLREDSDEAAELAKIDSKIRLDKANLDVRSTDPAMMQKKVQELSALYIRRNSLVKKEQRVNVNETIARDLNITSRQVQKYKAISILIPELQKLFEEKGINVNEGAGYAKLDEAEQRQLLALFEAGEDKKEINELYSKLNSLNNEIESGKRSIQKLEQEKQEAMQAADEERRAAALLEEKIRAEIEKENWENQSKDKKYIEELQAQLETVNRNIEQYKKKNTELESEKTKKVADLELKLAAKEKQALIAPTKIARTALKLDGILDSLQSLMTQFRKTVDEYQDIYDSESGELAPDEYRERLEHLTGAAN